ADDAGPVTVVEVELGDLPSAHYRGELLEEGSSFVAPTSAQPVADLVPRLDDDRVVLEPRPALRVVFVGELLGCSVPAVTGLVPSRLANVPALIVRRRLGGDHRNLRFGGVLGWRRFSRSWDRDVGNRGRRCRGRRCRRRLEVLEDRHAALVIRARWRQKIRIVGEVESVAWRDGV